MVAVVVPRTLIHETEAPYMIPHYRASVLPRVSTLSRTYPEDDWEPSQLQWLITLLGQDAKTTGKDSPQAGLEPKVVCIQDFAHPVDRSVGAVVMQVVLFVLDFFLGCFVVFWVGLLSGHASFIRLEGG